MPVDAPPATPSLVLWAARRVFLMHTEPTEVNRSTGSCKQCRPEGCEMLAWAGTILRESRLRANAADHYEARRQ
ncbi:hypothetical protein [Micromonospora sp. NBC_01796]|uniref:hypothetical protein n=1 Tax=Micromonospora sp. NBC_01796 TaxID=2975987 RepID=UPI002DDA4520|nr:hypothetical protein [Micromonospora sp. NBC_01796]WSA88745.1 hypothetical protein OIE47_14700 [Micromonospora sp. NBC_01796]